MLLTINHSKKWVENIQFGAYNGAHTVCSQTKTEKGTQTLPSTSAGTQPPRISLDFYAVLNDLGDLSKIDVSETNDETTSTNQTATTQQPSSSQTTTTPQLPSSQTTTIQQPPSSQTTSTQQPPSSQTTKPKTRKSHHDWMDPIVQECLITG